jgi:hypothetical protein
VPLSRVPETVRVSQEKKRHFQHEKRHFGNKAYRRERAGREEVSMRTMEVSFVSEKWPNEPASFLAKWGMV